MTTAVGWMMTSPSYRWSPKQWFILYHAVSRGWAVLAVSLHPWHCAGWLAKTPAAKQTGPSAAHHSFPMGTSHGYIYIPYFRWTLKRGKPADRPALDPAMTPCDQFAMKRCKAMNPTCRCWCGTVASWSCGYPCVHRNLPKPIVQSLFSQFVSASGWKSRSCEAVGCVLSAERTVCRQRKQDITAVGLRISS